MSRKTTAIGTMLAFLPLLALAAPSPGEAPPPAASDSSKTVSRVYHFQYLAPKEAWGIAQEQCRAATRGPGCYGQFFDDKSYMQIQADEATHAAIAEALKAMDLPPATQTFQLLLLEASKTGATDDTIPESARQALEGLQGFLPYRSFHVIDSGWVRTSSKVAMTLGAGGYNVGFEFRGDPRSGGTLAVDDFVLTSAASQKTILRTSLTLSVGETVVLGSSKLDGGDKALVVLLTAAK